MPPALNQMHTLVLNADYRPLSYHPLSLLSWQDAIKALLMGRVQVVSEYDTSVRSPSVELKIPSIVSLKRYIPSDQSKPAFTRFNIFLRDRFSCQYCGDSFEYRTLTLDHVLPKSKGGKTTWENVVTACRSCNIQKGDKIPGKNFMRPLQKPVMPTSYELQKLSQEMARTSLPDCWMDYLG
ncbi:MAG: HNH endonuclease [Alphaproteobacteria bacterium]|nr:HNH endonuclease [Alphaproteobacteria bacterium]